MNETEDVVMDIKNDLVEKLRSYKVDLGRGIDAIDVWRLNRLADTIEGLQV